jgi:hypothetical protein
MLDLLKRIFKVNTKSQMTKQETEQKEFSDGVKKQFQKLKEKGLSIPVFTL